MLRQSRAPRVQNRECADLHRVSSERNVIWIVYRRFAVVFYHPPCHARWRFVDGRFVTGEICVLLLAACLLLVSCNSSRCLLLLPACCLMFAATAACCMLPFQLMFCAVNPSTPSPQPAACYAAVAAVVAAAATITGLCLLHMFCLFQHAACCLLLVIACCLLCTIMLVC